MGDCAATRFRLLALTAQRANGAATVASGKKRHVKTTELLRSARTALFWLIALTVFYALTADQPYLQENVAAVVLAAFATILVMVAAANWGSGVFLPWREVAELHRPIAHLPRAVAIVSARVVRAVFTGRILRGRKSRSPYRYGRDKSARDVGRRAVTSYNLNLAPDSMLVAFVPEDDEIVVHRIS